MNFTNKVAIVTGAGGGLGLAIIEKFARGGAAIVALDYSQKMADAAAEKVRAITIAQSPKRLARLIKNLKKSIFWSIARACAKFKQSMTLNLRSGSESSRST